MPDACAEPETSAVSLGATACGAPCERLVPCVTRRGSKPGSDADVAEPRRGLQVVEPKAKACAPRAALRLALAYPVVVLTPPTRAPACAPACHPCDQRTACRFHLAPRPTAALRLCPHLRSVRETPWARRLVAAARESDRAGACLLGLTRGGAVQVPVHVGPGADHVGGRVRAPPTRRPTLC
jgi:hypothetical protein